MPVSTDFQDLKANIQLTAYDFDPGGTSAVDVAWVDMRDSTAILIGFFRTIGTGATTLAVLGNSASDGSGTDVTIKTKTLTSAEPNAVGDYTWIEVSEAEIAQAAADAGEADVRYVTASVSVATGTDEAVIIYVRKPKHKKLNLTADNIA